MDTQNTPVHIKLWHREFWMMAFANLLLMMSAYMLIPALPPYLLQQGYSCLQVGCVMGAYGIGVFVLGTFCSYLIQRYRRNHSGCGSLRGCPVLPRLYRKCEDGVLDVGTEQIRTRSFPRFGRDDAREYINYRYV